MDDHSQDGYRVLRTIPAWTGIEERYGPGMQQLVGELSARFHGAKPSEAEPAKPRRLA
jgi:hypothetical protein